MAGLLPGAWLVRGLVSLEVCRLFGNTEESFSSTLDRELTGEVPRPLTHKGLGLGPARRSAGRVFPLILYLSINCMF